MNEKLDSKYIFIKLMFFTKIIRITKISAKHGYFEDLWQILKSSAKILNRLEEKIGKPFVMSVPLF